MAVSPTNYNLNLHPDVIHQAPAAAPEIIRKITVVALNAIAFMAGAAAWPSPLFLLPVSIFWIAYPDECPRLLRIAGVYLRSLFPPSFESMLANAVNKIPNITLPINVSLSTAMHVSLVGLSFFCGNAFRSVTTELIRLWSETTNKELLIRNLVMIIVFYGPTCNKMGEIWCGTMPKILLNEEEFYSSLLQTAQKRKWVFCNSLLHKLPLNFLEPLLLKSVELMTDQELEEGIDNKLSVYKTDLLDFMLMRSGERGLMRLNRYLENKTAELEGFCTSLESSISALRYDSEASDLLTSLNGNLKHAAKLLLVAPVLNYKDFPGKRTDFSKRIEGVRKTLSENGYQDRLLAFEGSSDVVDPQTPAWELLPDIFREDKCQMYLAKLHIPRITGKTALETFTDVLRRHHLFTREEMLREGLYPLAGATGEERSNLYLNKIRLKITNFKVDMLAKRILFTCVLSALCLRTAINEPLYFAFDVFTYSVLVYSSPDRVLIPTRVLIPNIQTAAASFFSMADAYSVTSLILDWTFLFFGAYGLAVEKIREELIELASSFQLWRAQ